jgi:hypothetical protein
MVVRHIPDDEKVKTPRGAQHHTQANIDNDSTHHILDNDLYYSINLKVDLDKYVE